MHAPQFFCAPASTGVGNPWTSVQCAKADITLVMGTQLPSEWARSAQANGWGVCRGVTLLLELLIVGVPLSHPRSLEGSQTPGDLIDHRVWACYP